MKEQQLGWCSLEQSLRMLEIFIDSLPEEHNEDLEEEISNYIKDNFFGSKSMGFLSNRTKGELDSIDVVNIARHFAEWQKEQDNVISRQAEAARIKTQQLWYEKGRFDMREEMMKDAVEIPKQCYDNHTQSISCCLPIGFVKDKSRLKIIIVKED